MYNIKFKEIILIAYETLRVFCVFCALDYLLDKNIYLLEFRTIYQIVIFTLVLAISIYISCRNLKKIKNS